MLSRYAMIGVKGLMGCAVVFGGLACWSMFFAVIGSDVLVGAPAAAKGSDVVAEQTAAMGEEMVAMAALPSLPALPPMPKIENMAISVSLPPGTPAEPPKKAVIRRPAPKAALPVPAVEPAPAPKPPAPTYTRGEDHGARA